MPRGPQPIGDILAELMARRGFARVSAAEQFDAAWREAAGSLAAEYTRVGAVRRGKLEVIVANSTLVQELGFQKPTILEALARLLPDEGIKDLRFRVGVID
jgi:predicted nucleic acid-binding Zn ribbon protein